MDELLIDGQVFVPTRRAAEITGYAKDYIGQLCREGRVVAKLVGRSWYVLETSLREHRFGNEGSENIAKEAVGTPEAHPVEGEESQEETTQTWSEPIYTPEEFPEIILLDNETNYLENTTQKVDEHKVDESPVEAAWKDWYSKKQESQPMAEEIHEETFVDEQKLEISNELPSSEADFEPVQEEIIEERQKNRIVPGSMDIGPAIPIHREYNQHFKEEKPRLKRKDRHEGQVFLLSPLILKALFIGYVIIAVAIAVIGTGLFTSLAQNPILDFIGGIERLHKI